MLDHHQALTRSIDKLNSALLNAFHACGVKEASYTSHFFDLSSNTWEIIFPHSSDVGLLLHTAIQRALFEHGSFLSLFFDTGSMEIEGTRLEIVPLREDWFLCVLNAVIADSLQLINDEVAAHPECMSEILPKHQRILPSLAKGLHFSQITEKKTVRALEGILTEEELTLLFQMMIKEYVLIKEEELNQMIETFQDHELIVFSTEIRDLGFEAKAKVFYELILPKMEMLK